LFNVLRPRKCKQTAEFIFGQRDANIQYKYLPIVWGGAGFLAVVLGALAGVGATPESYFGPLMGASTGTILTAALLAFKPKPKVIPENINISEETLECYRDGYGKRARGKCATGAVIGIAVGWSTALFVDAVLRELVATFSSE
jgi:hypothetical protein